MVRQATPAELDKAHRDYIGIGHLMSEFLKSAIFEFHAAHFEERDPHKIVNNMDFNPVMEVYVDQLNKIEELESEVERLKDLLEKRPIVHRCPKTHTCGGEAAELTAATDEMTAAGDEAKQVDQQTALSALVDLPAGAIQLPDGTILKEQR